MNKNERSLRRRPGVRRCVIGWLGVTVLAITVSAADEPVKIDFRNRIPGVLDAPVYDADGRTRLADSHLMAQLYVGSTADALAPAGPLTAMGTEDGAGYWEPQVIPLPGTQVGSERWVQVRVFEPTGSFEEGPRLLGMGYAFKLSLTNSPMPLIGLKSFSLFPARLDVQRRGNELLVRWGNIGGVDSYTLEAATSLDSPLGWTPVFSAGRDGPFEYTAAILAAEGQRYFRLKWWR